MFQHKPLDIMRRRSFPVFFDLSVGCRSLHHGRGQTSLRDRFVRHLWPRPSSHLPPHRVEQVLEVSRLHQGVVSPRISGNLSALGLGCRSVTLRKEKARFVCNLHDRHFFQLQLRPTTCEFSEPGTTAPSCFSSSRTEICSRFATSSASAVR